MKLNIRTKLFLLLAGLTALILIGVLLVITVTISNTVEEKILEDFNRTQVFIQRQQSLIYDRLVESCYLIAENSVFKANVSLQDPASVYFSIEEFGSFAKVDLFIVTDNTGMVLARLGEPDHFGDDLTYRASVFRALNGEEPDFEPSWAELWAIDSMLFQVVSLPIYAKNSLIGTISLGRQITSYDAYQLKGESNFDISLFLNHQLIGTTIFDTLTITDQHLIDDFTDTHINLINAVISTLSSSGAFSTTLLGEEIYGFIFPLGEGEQAYYLASVPKSIELRILNTLRSNLFLTSMISLIFTVILAFFLGRTFSKPILQLVKGMNKVKEGDLSVTIEPSTKDEIGLLTQTFNGMIIGLRERFHLTKYVGTHTLDMIRKSSGAEASLGGTRREMAVLFSDVRGFTAFSENRTPEEVIEMLNKYLGFQAEFVTLYQGSVDKFVGDEMVALFDGDDGIKRALDCAIAIQKLVKKEQSREKSSINVGIGINFGSMILGNMGAIDRMDYTVIGAAVNLAARLCSSAEPGQILIPREILKKLNSDFRAGSTNSMAFKGFSNKIEITEILYE